MKLQLLGAVLTCASLAACGQSEPRSTQYFKAHIDEARKIVNGCRDGTIRGGECDNADLAVKQADAKEKSRRFFGTRKDRTAPNSTGR